jgi:malonate-semialdehyde dehydrogenase (acetylating)/methylmalonate-semialdehyde dehydrogenase
MPDADMDQTVDALIGAGYGSAGERCMAISVAVPVGKTAADRLMEKLIPRVESLKIGTSVDPSADYGPLVTREAVEKVKSYIDIGIKEGATLAVDGRGFKMQGYENGLLSRRFAVRQRHQGHADLQGRDLWPGALGGARPRLQGSAGAAVGP